MTVLERKRSEKSTGRSAQDNKGTRPSEMQTWRTAFRVSLQVWPLGPGPKDRRELARASTGEAEVQSGNELLQRRVQHSHSEKLEGRGRRWGKAAGGDL